MAVPAKSETTSSGSTTRPPSACSHGPGMAHGDAAGYQEQRSARACQCIPCVTARRGDRYLCDHTVGSILLHALQSGHAEAGNPSGHPHAAPAPRLVVARLLAPTQGTRPMALRFAKLPIIAYACLIAGVVIGLVLAPASAQQMMSGIDGQVAVRSDYAVYLISNGQRRWIATVMITDEEINAYPESEPIFSGVTPLPPQPGQSAPPPVPAAPPSPPP